MSEPFFSVIVPVHNGAEYIRKGLSSIRKQTFTDYELIVIADKCQDDSAKIALGYSDRLITTDYGLCGLARNAGMDVAEGKYLLFMDDDDWWINCHAFGMIADMLRVNNSDILLFGSEWSNGYTIIQTEKRMLWAVWCKAWRREFVGDVRFDDFEYGEDVQFTKTLLAKNPNKIYLDVPLYYYNFNRPGSQTWRYKRGEIKYESAGNRGR